MSQENINDIGSDAKPMDIAVKYNIAVYQVLSELKKMGSIYTRNEVINKEDTEKLIKIFDEKYPIDNETSFIEKQARKLTEDDRILTKDDVHAFLNQILEQANDKMEELKSIAGGYDIFIPDANKIEKIEKILNVCFSLTPQAKVTVDDDKLNEEIVISSLDLVSVIESVSNIYDLENDLEKIKNDNYTLENLKIKTISDSKSNKYTSALLRIVYFFIKNINKKIISELNLATLSFIADLLVEMKAFESAIELFNIEESIYYDANRLASLANSAITIGKIDFAEKVNLQLAKTEPYHPAITTIDLDIKRIRNIKSLSNKFLDLNSLDLLSGVEFENLLLEKFISLGFKAQPTPKTGDYGADIIVENDEGTKFIVQCKRFNSKVNLKAVQEVIGAMGHYAGDIGIVITNNSFLNSAIKLAESHDIELWDGDKLVSFLASDLSFSRIIS